MTAVKTKTATPIRGRDSGGEVKYTPKYKIVPNTAAVDTPRNVSCQLAARRISYISISKKIHTKGNK
jgi:hypothetical protein